MAALAPGGTACRSGVLACPLSPERLEWEHLQRVLADKRGNITATAQALGMHRRTLLRKLAKRPPRER